MKVKEKNKPKSLVLSTPATECEYCEEGERYSLDPARQEEDSVFWHYEVKTYCRAVPRTRVRCRKN